MLPQPATMMIFDVSVQTLGGKEKKFRFFGEKKNKKKLCVSSLIVQLSNTKCHFFKQTSIQPNTFHSRSNRSVTRSAGMLHKLLIQNRFLERELTFSCHERLVWQERGERGVCVLVWVAVVGFFTEELL